MKGAPGKTILLVDDEAAIRRLLTAQIDDFARVIGAASAEAAWEILLRVDVDLLITDLRMKGEDGLSLLQRVRAGFPDVPVIVVTAFGSIESAVEAMRGGAFDYLTKPVEMKTFRQCVERAFAFRRLSDENQYLRECLGEADLPEIVGESPGITTIRRRVREAAAGDATVLLTGESGTGKGVVARSIHSLSGRKGPFVRVNCAALPEALLESELFGHVRGAFTGALRARKGKFQLADGGTIFLDEIGAMPISLQAKLLHVLEDGAFTPVGGDLPLTSNARVIAATNEDLEESIRQGRFRSDLFWRLNVLSMKLPPLKARLEDVVPLARHLLERLSPGRRAELSPEAAAALAAHSWPGNVRELENMLRRALSRFPAAESLPRAAIDLPGLEADETFILKDALSRTERAFLAEALRRTEGRKAQAAELLGISPRMMSYYLEKYPDLDR